MTPDAPFDARLAAKKLLREGRSGALATLMAGSGDPYCSLVNVATARDEIRGLRRILRCAAGHGPGERRIGRCHGVPMVTVAGPGV